MVFSNTDSILGNARVIAVISDVHANMEALNAVWEDIRNQMPDRVISLGDIIDYGPEPEEAVRFFRARNIPTVCGNHEYALLDRTQREHFNMFGLQAVKLTENLITKESKDYLATLPPTIHEQEMCFVHGFPPDSAHTYLFEADEMILKDTFEEYTDFTYCFVGHTHELDLVVYSEGKAKRIALKEGKTKLDQGRYIINCGSVGQPRDEDNRAKYALFDRKTKTLEMRFVEYDYKTTIKKLLDRGFPENLARRLR